MAGDIIEYSNVDTADIALLKVIRRYNAWLKLLDHKDSAILGSNMQKGLIGEVLFLKEKILSGFHHLLLCLVGLDLKVRIKILFIRIAGMRLKQQGVLDRGLNFIY